MKKLLSLLLVLVCTISLVSCGGTNDEAARETVIAFMDAIADLDAETAEKYVDDASALPTEFKNLDLSKLMEGMPSDLGDYTDDFETLFSGLMDKVKKEISYEIKESKKTDDGFVFTLDVTFPDFETTNIDTLLEEQLDEESMQTLLMDMFTSGEITADSTETDIMNLIMPKMLDMLKTAFDKIEITTKTNESVFVVTKTDGQWLINTEKSNLGN